MFQDFLNSFEDMGNNPQDLGLREITVEKAKTMVDRFHATADSLDETRKDVYQDLGLNVDKVNDLLQRTAELNKNIAVSKSQTGTQAQTYIDEREKNLEELSQLVGISVTQEDDGQINAYINGVNVITGPSYSKFNYKKPLIL